jgi:predicted Zn-dependent peptidase
LLDDPGFLTEDLRRYRAVDPGAIQRVAQEVLNKDGRVVVTIEPNPDAPIMGRVKQ